MVKLLDKEVPTGVVVGAALAAPLVLRAGSKLLSGPHKVVQNGRFKGAPLPQDVYDAVIVGAGPSGSTCAHFFCKARRCTPLRLGGATCEALGQLGACAALLRLSRDSFGLPNYGTLHRVLPLHKRWVTATAAVLTLLLHLLVSRC